MLPGSAGYTWRGRIAPADHPRTEFLPLFAPAACRYSGEPSTKHLETQHSSELGVSTISPDYFSGIRMLSARIEFTECTKGYVHGKCMCMSTPNGFALNSVQGPGPYRRLNMQENHIKILKIRCILLQALCVMGRDASWKAPSRSAC